jgi:TolB-like protein
MKIEPLHADSAPRAPPCENHTMQPTADEVRAALERVLAGGSFAGSSRLSRFLRFVVERSLAGEAERLKEYVIGVEVFDRDERYDPRVDSIVRVEAGRLRTKLEEYYRGAGSGDEVAIKLQKGGYAPEFERRGAATRAPSAPPATGPAAARAALDPASATRLRARRVAVRGVAVAAVVVVVAAAATAWRLAERAATADRTAARARPVIAVLPFTAYANDESARALASRLTDGVTAELVRLDRFGVVASTSARQFTDVRGSLGEVARALGADFLLQAHVLTENGGVRVNEVLVDGALGQKIWVDRVDGNAADLDELARRIAAGAAAAPLHAPR